MELLDTAKKGNRLATLEALRDKLAADLDVAQVGVSAQLASQLVKVLAEIDELRKSTDSQGSALDELAARRKDRLSEAGVSEPARRASRQRRSGSN